MVYLRQQPKTPEQKVMKHPSQKKLIKDLTITQTMIIQEKVNAKENRRPERKRKWCVKSS